MAGQSFWFAAEFSAVQILVFFVITEATCIRLRQVIYGNRVSRRDGSNGVGPVVIGRTQLRQNLVKDSKIIAYQSGWTVVSSILQFKLISIIFECIWLILCINHVVRGQISSFFSFNIDCRRNRIVQIL